MYVPKHFQAPSLEAVENFIHQNGFATLVSQDDSSVMATHTPLMIKEAEDGSKLLTGHISKANIQKESIASPRDVLAIFLEHHAYVSSSWYDHINVPTWNYIAVHVYGRARIIEGEELVRSLDRLVKKYEGDSADAFSITDMPDQMLKSEMNGIIGFDIEVSKVEASYKLSQNRNDNDYNNIIEKLENRGDQFSLKIAQEMRSIR